MKNVNIIKKNHEFQKIIGNKRYLKGKAFILYTSKNNIDNFKYGISVGKKLGNAIVRNKIKRQIRGMIKIILSEIIVKNIGLVIIVRNELLKRSFEENLNELKKLIALVK